MKSKSVVVEIRGREK